MNKPLSPSGKPAVHLYSICWNEETMLKYFFEHYDPLVDRYVFYDDDSTDQTLRILERHPRVEVRQLERYADADSYVLAAQHVHNTCWKESRGSADWVIITAVDEFLYTPSLGDYLTRCAAQEITAIPALGYQMQSRTLPTPEQSLLKVVRRGCPYVKMNKLSVFNPDKILETNQAPGRHKANPVGDVKYPARDELLLLHYKNLSFDFTFKRHAELLNKLGARDKQLGYDFRYRYSRAEFKAEWDQFERDSVADVFSPNYDPHRQHSPLATRWWRKGSLPARTGRDSPLFWPARLWVKMPSRWRAQIREIPAAKAVIRKFEHLFWNEVS